MVLVWTSEITHGNDALMIWKKFWNGCGGCINDLRGFWMAMEGVANKSKTKSIKAKLNKTTNLKPCQQSTIGGK